MDYLCNTTSTPQVFFWVCHCWATIVFPTKILFSHTASKNIEQETVTLFMFAIWWCKGNEMTICLLANVECLWRLVARKFYILSFFLTTEKNTCLITLFIFAILWFKGNEMTINLETIYHYFHILSLKISTNWNERKMFNESTCNNELHRWAAAEHGSSHILDVNRVL